MVRLEAICAGLRNGFCNSPIASSISAVSAGRSSRVARRCCRSTVRGSFTFGSSVVASLVFTSLDFTSFIRIHNPMALAISSTASMGDSRPAATAFSSCGNLLFSSGSARSFANSRSSSIDHIHVTC